MIRLTLVVIVAMEPAALQLERKNSSDISGTMRDVTDSPQTTPENVDSEATSKPVIAAGAAKRANASVIGMLLAMLSTLAIVMVIVWLNPQQKAEEYRQPVNVAAIAQNATEVAKFTPIAPPLPSGWFPNYARWNGAGTDGVAFWDVGIVTQANTFIALKQSITANPTWVAAQTANAPVTGKRTIDGVDWEIRDPGKGDKSLVLSRGIDTVILKGTADFKEFDVLAKAATQSLAKSPSTGSSDSASKDTKK